MGESTEPVENYDLMTIIMVCLGGPVGENYDGILRMLDVLLSNETSEAEKRKILQDDYDIQMTRTMEKEVSEVCNLSEGVWRKAMARGIEQGIEQGMAQGMEKGLAQGMARGHTDRALTDLCNLMETLGLSLEQAMAALKIPEAERSNYAGLLNN